MNPQAATTALELSKKQKRKLGQEAQKFNTLWDQLMDTSLAKGGVASRNFKVRDRKFARIMRKRHGKFWQDQMFRAELAACQDRTAASAYMPMTDGRWRALLAKLDRAGKLVDGLTVAEVWAIAEQQAKVWAAGKHVGRAWTAQNGPPKKSKVAICAELARLFGVEEEVQTHGDNWLDGFIAGVVEQWADRCD